MARWNCLGVLPQLLRPALSSCWARLLPRTVTAAQLLAIESQLAAELNRSLGRPQRHRSAKPKRVAGWLAEGAKDATSSEEDGRNGTHERQDGTDLEMKVIAQEG